MHQSRNYKFLTLFIKITPWIYLNIKRVIYLKRIKIDTYIGMGFSNLIAFFIMLAVARERLGLGAQDPRDILRSNAALAGALVVPGLSVAAPKKVAISMPDFTKGDTIPAKAKHDWNLGPTGLRGWIFSDQLVTSDARQISLTKVEKGSPADGLFLAGDVILGVGGKPFSYDPRTEFGKAAAHRELVLGEHQRLRRWQDVDALADEGVQQFGGDVLMVEGQRGGAVSRHAQRLQIGMGSDHHIRTDLCGRIIGADRQYPQGLTQSDRSLMRHPGQLPAAHHCHHRCVRHGTYRVTTGFRQDDQHRYATQPDLP